jgi:hypothetical protein
MVNKMPKWGARELFRNVKDIYTRGTIDEATACFLEEVRIRAESLRHLGSFNKMMRKGWEKSSSVKKLSRAEKKIWPLVAQEMKGAPDHTGRDDNDLLINR